MVAPDRGSRGEWLGVRCIGRGPHCSHFYFLLVQVVFVCVDCLFWLNHVSAQTRVGSTGSNTFLFKHALTQASPHHQCCPASCGSIVGAGWAVVTYVSEPPRGRRWETDLVIQIGLRMLTHQVLSRTDDQQYLTNVLGKTCFFSYV